MSDVFGLISNDIAEELEKSRAGDGRKNVYEVHLEKKNAFNC